LKKLVSGIILSLLLVSFLGLRFMVRTSMESTGVNGKTQKSNLGFHTLLKPPSLEWNITYSAGSDDRAFALVQTTDGGYAFSGQSWVNSSVNPSGDYDFLLVKTDASGNVEWNQTYGGTSDDARSTTLVQTGDGGYALAGFKRSRATLNVDFWFVKTDASGNIEWNQTYGGPKDDNAFALVQTTDGGYALAGLTSSFGSGGSDFWLVKTDASGNMQWNRTYGGPGMDVCYAMVQTSDGGYALAGYTGSFGAGGYDFLLVKTDASGNMMWNQTYDKSDDDEAWALVQTADGGYALAGYTGSYATGDEDYWLVKTDANGNAQWNETYGGPGIDNAGALVQTPDGGYMLAGASDSWGSRNYEAWLVKTDASGNEQWNETIGGSYADFSQALVHTRDGGYAFAGMWIENDTLRNDAWLVKLAAPEVDDVAVTNVTTPKAGCVPMSTVGQNLTVTVNVTVANVGDFEEITVPVKVYATPIMSPSIVIDSATISLDVGQSITLNFTWNTTGFAYGNYTISATAGPVPSETNTGDNTFTDGIILVTIPGDIDGDGTVFLSDLGLMAAAWSSTPASPNWNPNADIIGEGQVFLGSLAVMAAHWTQSWTPP
jgi:hypothetical protein